MKTTKLKLAIGVLLTSVAVMGTTNSLMAQAKTEGPVLTVEKADINKDLVRIKSTRERMSDIRVQYKDEKAAKQNTIATCKNMKKARADYRNAKAYLRADKRDLIADHNKYIAERRSAVRADYMAWAKLEAKPAKKLGSKNEKQVRIAVRKEMLKDDKTALKQAKINRNNDVLAINQKIEDVNGQNVALLRIQNGEAKMQNSLAMK